MCVFICTVPFPKPFAWSDSWSTAHTTKCSQTRNQQLVRENSFSNANRSFRKGTQSSHHPPKTAQKDVWTHTSLLLPQGCLGWKTYLQTMVSEKVSHYRCLWSYPDSCYPEMIFWTEGHLNSGLHQKDSVEEKDAVSQGFKRKGEYSKAHKRTSSGLR